MKSQIKENVIKNNKIARYLALSAVLISGLFLSGCASDPYEDDYGYSSSQGEYYGDNDEGYVDAPNTRVEVYASTGSRYNHSRYYDPYYARHYDGYYFDPFYGVYYSYGSGAYGAYGSYRTGFGYYCPLHRSYFGHTHYRSHNHSRHHHNVIRYDRNRHRRAANHRDYRNRNDLIQPNTEALASVRRGSGNRNRDTNNPRRNRDTSLSQGGLDGVIASRDRQVQRNRTRDQSDRRRLRNRDTQETVRGTSPITRGVVEPRENTRSQTQSVSDSRRRQIAAARAEHARRAAAANEQNSSSQQSRRETRSNNSSRREQAREQSESRSRSRSSNSERSRSSRSRSRSRSQRH